MTSDPIIEHNDGTNLSLGGFKMRIDYAETNEQPVELSRDMREISITVGIPPFEIPIVAAQPVYSKWRRLWLFLNLDVRDIYTDYIRPYIRSLWRN